MADHVYVCECRPTQSGRCLRGLGRALRRLFTTALACRTTLAAVWLFATCASSSEPTPMTTGTSAGTACRRPRLIPMVSVEKLVGVTVAVCYVLWRRHCITWQ